MNPADWILLLILLVWFVVVLVLIKKKKKSGPCSGCSGGCCESCELAGRRRALKKDMAEKQDENKNVSD
jgi:preprotein translocase subunit SecG